MAAGTVDRARPDPAPRSPIVVEDYTAELNQLKDAHNDLYNDWEPTVTDLRTVLDDATTPEGAKKLTANGVVIGDTLNTIAADGRLAVNGTYIESTGLVYTAPFEVDVSSWAPSSSHFLSDLGSTAHATYVFTGTSYGSPARILTVGNRIPIGAEVTFVYRAVNAPITLSVPTEAGSQTFLLDATGDWVRIMAYAEYSDIVGTYHYHIILGSHT